MTDKAILDEPLWDKSYLVDAKTQDTTAIARRMSFVYDTESSGCLGKKMSRYLLLICVFGLQVSDSTELPPRLAGCRQVYKAKPPANAPPTWTHEYIFSDDGKIIYSLLFFWIYILWTKCYHLFLLELKILLQCESAKSTY